MKKILDLVQHHGFIASTSVAMFVHSTWTFNTLFAGEQPILDGTLQAWIPYLMWVIPGALIALAIDVGQIQTSARIKHARGWVQLRLVLTFVMLASAGYYLQWFHMAHHLPSLELGQGLSQTHHATVELLKGWAIWVIPALLPLSTILYTISDVDRGDVVPDLQVRIVDHAPVGNPSDLSNSLGDWLSRPGVDDDEFDVTPYLEDTEPVEIVESTGYKGLNTDPELQSERASKPNRARKGNKRFDNGNSVE